MTTTVHPLLHPGDEDTGAPAQQTDRLHAVHDGGTEFEADGATFRDDGHWLLAFGTLTVTAVAGCTAVLGLPHEDAYAVVVVALLIVGSVMWLAALVPLLRSRWLITTFLVGFGLCGAGLDFVQPEGPGFVAVYLSMAGLGYRLPPRWATWGAVPVLAAGAIVEAYNAEYPLAAVINITLGAGVLFVVSSFASVSRDARSQLERLMAQEATTRQTRERASALAERARLTREIHDLLAHTLSGLTVQLEGARLLATGTGADHRLAEQITNAQRLARDGLVDAKRAVAALRGGPMPNAELLPELVQKMQDGGLPVTLHSVGVVRHLPPEVGLAVYRTVQEALTNVTRHAGSGASVTVTLTYRASDVIAEVTNRSGSGDSPNRGVSGTGMGLSGMAERASLLGGDLRAGVVDGGFRVSLRVPAPRLEAVESA